MSQRCCLILVSVLVCALAVGCGGRAIKRAPVDTIPEEAEMEVKVEMLEEMAAEYPEDATIYYEIGNLYYDDLMALEAMENYSKALEVDHSFNKARVNLAMILAESDEVDSAKVLLEEAIAIDPQDGKAYNNLGMIYYTELDVDSAVGYFLKALEMDPQNVEARYNLGLAFAETGLLLEAIREWRKVLEVSEEGETAQRAKLSLDRAEKELKQ
jgi:tetratricopeptide (TPR) repeat protein